MRSELQIPQQDLPAACAYLAGEGLVTVDWEQGNTPAMVTLTHQGIRLTESGEENAADAGRKPFPDRAEPNGDENRETPDA